MIVYATGYNITFPFFDEEFLSAPGNRIRLFKRMFKPGARRPGVHGLRAGGARRCSRSSRPGPAARGVRRGRVRAARRRRDGAGDRRGRREALHRPRAPTGPGTPSRSTTSSTSTTCAPRSSRPAGPGRRPARAGLAGHDASQRAPAGDDRRTALLESLDHHLREEGSLDSINIADISRRAGVTRSAFYFYFENKASAVAALMEEMYDESFAAADLLRGGRLAGREHRGDGARAVLDVGQARAPVPGLARRPRHQRDGARAVGQRPGVVRRRWSPR